MHLVAVRLVLLLTVWVGIQSLGCSQQSASPPETKQETSAETAVGEMTRTAIDKAKAVEGTLQQSADRTADTLNAPTRWRCGVRRGHTYRNGRIDFLDDSPHVQ